MYNTQNFAWNCAGGARLCETADTDVGKGRARDTDIAKDVGGGRATDTGRDMDGQRHGQRQGQ